MVHVVTKDCWLFKKKKNVYVLIGNNLIFNYIFHFTVQSMNYTPSMIEREISTNQTIYSILLNSILFYHGCNLSVALQIT